MYISGRQRGILNILLKSKKHITITSIAEELNVSQRTVHRDLKAIEELLPDYNLTLKKKTGIGVTLQGYKKDKDYLLNQINETNVTDYTFMERQTVILSTLLEADMPIKSFVLANELQVSSATLSNDLDAMVDMLNDFDLQLIRKQGNGIEIRGNESSKRSLVSHLISDNIDPFEFVNLSKKHTNDHQSAKGNIISNRLLGLVDGNKLNRIEKVVQTESKNLSYQLADNSYVGLVVHLALALERFQKGDIIKISSQYLEKIADTKEYGIAYKIMRSLEIELAISMPEDEVGYITMHLLGAKLRGNQEYLLEDSSLDIAKKVQLLIENVGEQMQVDFKDDATLLYDLTAHLKPTIYRLQQRMNIKNPLMNEIRRDYNELFQLVKKGTTHVFTDIVFPDSEIAYIVLHFAASLLSDQKIGLKALVICASGIGTAKILSTKLLRRIPEIKEVENKSMFDLEELNYEDYDLIISTVHLNDFNEEYIVVSPILNKEEIHHIQSIIRKRKITHRYKKHYNGDENSALKLKQGNFSKNLKLLEQYSKVMNELLDGFQVSSLVNMSTSQQSIQSICEALEKEKRIDSQTILYNDLIKREKLGGLGIPGTEMALYHTRSESIIKPTIKIYSLSTPLEVVGMDNKRMKIKRIILMLAPKNPSEELLAVLSLLSGLIIQDEQSLSLFETADTSNINIFLSNQFRTFLEEKNII